VRVVPGSNGQRRAEEKEDSEKGDRRVRRIKSTHYKVIDRSLMNSYEVPLDFIRHNIGQPVSVRLRNRVAIRGRLAAYDDHLNMMIEDADLQKEGLSQHKHLVYVRGDMILLVGKD
jgi:small nuclear ribonucleoprotein (snRNP)-like protein